jgi:ribokinase
MSTPNSLQNDVIVVGSYNHDHVWRVDRFPTAGETRRGNAFITGSGGKGFNQAVACARQGAPTAFIAACGEDTLGALARDFAQGEGMRGLWLVLPDHATGTAAILVDSRGQNEIVVALGANEYLVPAFVRAQESAFAQARVVLCQLENNLDAVTCALELAAAHGCLRILNPAPIREGAGPEVFRAADLITPNETEFSQILGRCVGMRIDPTVIATENDAALHALCRQLPVDSVIVTLGSRGAFVSHSMASRRGDADAYYRVPPEKVETIDTTGAGDAFSGALAAALAMRPDQAFHEAVQQASRVAAMSTEKHGAAVAIPRAAEVAARFERKSNA